MDKFQEGYDNGEVRKMKQLMIRADDFGISFGTIPAILKGFEEGIITCTGVMINMPSAYEACFAAKENPQFCFGQDINIATGKPVADPDLIPNMLDESGNFRRSPIIRQLVKEGKEPFNYEEVKTEIKAQVDRFIQLVGRKPEYLNGHAFRTPNFSKALFDVAHEYDILCMDEMVEKYDLENHGFLSSGSFQHGWYPKDNSYENQLNTDAEKFFLDHYEELNDRDYGFLICHPAYIDSLLMKCSSLNLVRMKDLDMVLSGKIKEKLEQDHVQLLSVPEFVKEKDN